MTTAQATLPRLPIAGLIAVIGVTVALTAFARISGYEPTVQIETTAAQDSRLLRFEDRPDGSVAVIDALTNQDIANAAPATNGFLRGALRGLMRERKRAGKLATESFRLERYADGQIILTDEATGNVVALNAFGPTNAAVFAAFLSTKNGGSK